MARAGELLYLVVVVVIYMNDLYSDSPFGPSTFRRSINRKSGRFGRRSMRRAERPEIKISSSNDMNNNGETTNGADVSLI